MNKIEFYKNRSLGERFSASAAFIRQNWKVMYKIILIPSIPLALLQGYFQQDYSQFWANLPKLFDGDTSWLSEISNNNSGISSLIALLFALVLSSISSAIMSRYEEGSLSMETSLQDLSSKIVSNMKKLFFIGLTLSVMGIVAVIPIGLIIGILFAAHLPVLAAIVVFLLIVAICAIIPFLYLARFPALFRGEPTMGSIRKGFRLGFKNWGSTYAMIIILGIATSVISLILGVPYTIYLLFGQPTGVVAYILGSISWLGAAFITPLTFVFFAFQYFAIAENEESISLQAKVEEFDNL